MDVICFVWDQCFIGLETSQYQFMPYFVATWLLVMKLRLSDCHSVGINNNNYYYHFWILWLIILSQVESVEEMLLLQSSKMTLEQLQKEVRLAIESRHASVLLFTQDSNVYKAQISGLALTSVVWGWEGKPGLLTTLYSTPLLVWMAPHLAGSCYVCTPGKAKNCCCCGNIAP